MAVRAVVVAVAATSMVMNTATATDLAAAVAAVVTELIPRF
jgi:hypothetical protein